MTVGLPAQSVAEGATFWKVVFVMLIAEALSLNVPIPV